VNVHEALIQVRKEVGGIAKADRNTSQNFFFRGIDAILNKVGPAMVDQGVNCYPDLKSLDSRDVVTGKGTKMREVTLWVSYRYVGPEGDDVVITVPGEASDAGDKAVSKAMSVALRTAHLQALQIPTREADPDKHSMTRGVDPLTKVKNDIWAEARKQGWITQGENGEEYQQLHDDYALWSQGGDIAEAELEMLKKYLGHLLPKRTMKRGDS
jgi:hypothetical protein